MLGDRKNLNFLDQQSQGSFCGFVSYPTTTMVPMAYRTFRYKLHPTARQARSLTDLLAAQCEVYNAALEERREAWKKNVPIKRFDQFSQVRDLHEIRPDLMRFGVTVARGTLTRLDRAFSSFFRRTRAGDKPGYPGFRSQSRFDTVSYEDGCGWRLKEPDRRLYLQGVGHVKVNLHRELEGTPKTCHVRREGRKWWVLVQCEVPTDKPLEKTGRQAGFDLGVSRLVTCSDGSFYENPRHLRRSKEKLARAQRELSRKTKGSGRRRRAVEKVASCHRKIRNQRRNDLHKLSRDLVDSYDVLVFEDLLIENMTRSAKGTIEAPGSKVAQKAALNREILSASWGLLLNMLAYKAEGAGRELILVAPRGTSQNCSVCGHEQAENRVTQSEFRCLSCGHEQDADLNAARNILRLGLSQRREKREVETSAA